MTNSPAQPSFAQKLRCLYQHWHLVRMAGFIFAGGFISLVCHYLLLLHHQWAWVAPLPAWRLVWLFFTVHLDSPRMILYGSFYGVVAALLTIFVVPAWFCHHSPTSPATTP